MTGLPMPEPTCPHCHVPFGKTPFCTRDGTISGEGRFVIGTRYVAEELLGGGGTSFVFAGRHLVLGKPVAIKVLREESPASSLAARRFLREARNASQLAHENIISIIDFGHDDQHDLAYLAMELFAGQPLDEVIRTSAPIPPSRAIPMLVQLARALSVSHNAGVLHRDVKPRNILVGRADRIKLCDFGLARSASGGDRVTNTGTILGTPAYMAPEQIRGDDVSSATDLYAFGCTAYEMLTGRIPHDAKTPVAVWASRLNDRTIDTLDRGGLEHAELRELLGECLASDPTRRPTAADVEVRLLAISAASGPGRRPASLDGEMIGAYRVVRLLGKGGVSSVYLAEHPVIGTKVAIKVIAPHAALTPGISERFEQEARASTEIASPHLPRYFDIGVLPTGQPYAVMEYIEGETLTDVLFHDGARSVEYTASVVRQVATAMVAVHAAKLVHRDLKPDNLMIVPSGDGVAVKILDFGIAKAMTPGASATQTSLGMMVGTPYYCSPEQAMGEAVGPAADVYALAATAYEMLSGNPPFVGEIAQVLAAKTTREAPALPQHIDVRVRATIARMLARSPAERIASMTDVLAELDRWPGAAPSIVTASPRMTREAEPTKRLSKRAIGLGLASIAATAALVMAAVGRRDPEPAPAPASAPVVTPLEPAPVAPAPPVVELAPEPPPVTEPTPVAAPQIKKHPAHATSAAAKPTKSHHDDGVIVDPYTE